jgi:hypothetical protein
MKRYRKSILAASFYIVTLLSLIIQEIIDTHSYIRIFFIIILIILLIYEYKFSFYFIKEQKFSIPMGQKIDISQFKSIHKRKFFFFNKYYFDFKLSQFSWVSIFPLQSEINNLINDILEINPNVIIKEYKSYNEDF